jgi:Mn2+/Fe2+ NRAMP family transporter
MATLTVPARQDVALDAAHTGDIHGALGSIRLADQTTSGTWLRRLKTLLAIVGPGLIVMVGDNDAGAFGTYTQAGQTFGTKLLWTLLLLIPVLYVNQEMVLRLGAVTRVGHARLILKRFGRFWGAFSIIDLFVLNALTIMTEFIGITLALGYLGLPTLPGVFLAALVVIAAASTGSFKRFERVSLALVAGSLILIPVFLMAHPPIAQMAHDFVTPSLPHSSVSTLMLLIIAIVGTTIAPWQLFFQQSYIIDKRITTKYLSYERIDLWIGIGLVVIGAGAMMAIAAQAFGGHPEFGHFVDAGRVAAGIGHYIGRLPGVLFAVALLDASIIGTAAVSLSTAYAFGDFLSMNHSLHRSPKDAKAFYAIYVGLILLSALVVVIPGSPLGLITEGVQTLAGILLPSATVFLLLLCNDREVLGPWVNSKLTNIFSGLVVGALVLLSVILTASVVFPAITGTDILGILLTGIVLGGLLLTWFLLSSRHAPVLATDTDRPTWQMPPLSSLGRPEMSGAQKLGLSLMWLYLVIAISMVAVRVIQLAAH